MLIDVIIRAKLDLDDADCRTTQELNDLFDDADDITIEIDSVVNGSVSINIEMVSVEEDS